MILPETTPIFIYGLIDPRTNELRYVGQTKQSLSRRCNGHICDSRRGRTHCATWIRCLLAQNLKPEIFLIEEMNSENWDEAERFWISYFRFVGCDLTNHREGGGCNYTLTPEHRAKLSAAAKVRVFSPETRAKLSAARKRRVCSKETGAKFAEANKRRVWKEESRQAISSARRQLLATCWRSHQKPHTEEGKLKIGLSKLGKVMFAKEWTVIFPDGHSERIFNLAQFCRDNGLTYKSMKAVGLQKQKAHKGYRVTLCEPSDMP